MVAKCRGGPLPVKVPYDPLEDGASMQRFLRDLIFLTLARRILPRQASVCRAIVQTSLEANDLRDLELPFMLRETSGGRQAREVRCE